MNINVRLDGGSLFAGAILALAVVGVGSPWWVLAVPLMLVDFGSAGWPALSFHRTWHWPHKPA